MAENFPNLREEMDTQIQELKELQPLLTQRDLIKTHYNQIQKSKTTLEAAREKRLIMYNEVP